VLLLGWLRGRIATRVAQPFVSCAVLPLAPRELYNSFKVDMRSDDATGLQVNQLLHLVCVRQRLLPPRLAVPPVASR
jgi:hypothetical protein